LVDHSSVKRALCLRKDILTETVGGSGIQNGCPDDNSNASRIADRMLDASATPLPAMSYAVP
jgi:hypothetical protein